MGVEIKEQQLVVVEAEAAVQEQTDRTEQGVQMPPFRVERAGQG
jgi:hypothetical protein